VLPGLAWLQEQANRTGRPRGEAFGAPSAAAPSPGRPLVVGAVGYLVVLVSALLAGAEGRLETVSLAGLVLGASALLTAMARALAGAVAALADPRPAGLPDEPRVTVE
jgi:hypothetical protein